MDALRRAVADRPLLVAADAAAELGRILVVTGPPGSGVARGVALAAERFGDDVRVVPDLAVADPATVDGPAVAGLVSGLPVPDPAAVAALLARADVVALAPLTAPDVDLGAGTDVVLAVTAGNAGLAEAVAAWLPPAGSSRAADALAALARLLQPGGDVDDALRPLLGDVARQWGAWVAAMGPDAAALLEAVHVVGDGPLWLAAELADLDAVTAARAADALVGVGLLASADPVAPGLPLALAALAAATDGAVRAAGRRRAARRLAQVPDGVEAAAGHLLRVPPGGDPEAVGILREAARVAAADGRSAAAAARLERALLEPLEPAARVELLIDLGETFAWTDAGRAVATFERALPLAVDGQRPGVHLRLGRARYGSGDYRGAGVELERGLALAAGDDVLVAELLAAYVAAARFDRALEDAAARHLAPLLGRDEPGRNAAERNLLAELALERGIRGYPRDEVVGLALRAWGDGLLLEGADPYGIAISSAAAALTWSDAFEESDRVLSATLAHSERTGNAQLAATARYLRAWPRWYAGRLGEAEADVRAALGAPGWEMYEPSARAILGNVLLELGRPDEAAATLHLEQPEAWATTVPYAMLLETRSRLHVGAGDLEAAARDLEEVGALLETIGNTSPFCPWRSSLAVVRARLGALDEAQVLVGTELAQAEVIGTPRAIGTALHARGVVAGLAAAGDGATRDGDAGIDDLRAAVETLRDCGARTALARAQIDLGVALAAAGRRDDGREQLHRAHDLALGLGAAGIADRAGIELRRAGGRPRRRAERTPGGLTLAELRVARLAAAGRTNREIAEEVVVSTHTVRFHLAQVYRKLGVGSREEIGAALSAAG